jgi:hypothetical protein
MKLPIQAAAIGRRDLLRPLGSSFFSGLVPFQHWAVTSIACPPGATLCSCGNNSWACCTTNVCHISPTTGMCECGAF